MTDTAPSTRVIALMATACGAMVANLYYAQTLAGLIAPDLGLSAREAGLVVTLTQLGYGAGLALLVPLGDLFENRRLAVASALAAAVGSLAVALARTPGVFLAAALLTGVASVGAQVLVPMAAHLARPGTEGRTVGTVMGGLVTGIMLARPLASLCAAAAGWRAVFWLSAALLAAVAAALATTLPERRPAGGGGYRAALASALAQVGRHRALRLRAAYQGLLFAGFNLFWTAAPLALGQRFGLGQAGIAAFALAGAGGALSAPIAGRLADRGRGQAVTLAALALFTIGLLLTLPVVAAGALIGFAVLAIIIDAAVQLNQVSGQRVIFALDPAARGRINAAYMTIVFLLGATGSLLGSWSMARGGWPLAAGLAAALGLVALALFAAFDRRS